MVDRRRAIHALARRVAAERADRPAARPAGARIPLPTAHRADLTAAGTHQLRLTAPGIDPDRVAAALDRVAARHEALRLGATRHGGRWVLEPVARPVARAADTAALAHADPEHPLRWVLDGTVLTLAVSAYLMDRSAWPVVLTTLEAAYAGRDPAPAGGLDYGDYCHWLAYRPDPAGDLPAGADEPFWEFARAQPWAAGEPIPVDAGTRPRADAADALAVALARALRESGWRTPVYARIGRTRRPELPIVGRVDEPVLAPVDPETGVGPSAPVAAFAGAAELPVVHLDADVLDLPEIRLGDAPVGAEPVLTPAPGWQAVLVRRAGAADLHLAGPAATLPVLRAELAGRPRPGGPLPSLESLAGGPATGGPLPSLESPAGGPATGGPLPSLESLAGGPATGGPLPSLESPAGRPAAGGPLPSPGNPAGQASGGADGAAHLPAPALLTVHRTLPADLVEAGITRRAAELRAAGTRPGTAVVVEVTSGPETPATVLAALRLGADVLTLDPSDPPAWRSALAERLPDAVRVSADNTVHAPGAAGHGRGEAGPPARCGDGEGALLLGLSGAPGAPVLARVPLPDLLRAAAAVAALWRLGPDRVAGVRTGTAGEDPVVAVLACALSGATAAVLPDDGAEAVDMLAGLPDVVVDAATVESWAAPAHRITGLRRTGRGVRTAPGTVVRWWHAEAPAVQFTATGDGLVPCAGTAVVAGHDGRPLPDGTVGDLAVAVAPGFRYAGDPRRTAALLLPAPGGTRLLRTGARAGRAGGAVQPLRPAPDRVVRDNRTCLTDAWPAGAAAFAGPYPFDAPDAERMVVVAAAAPDVPPLPAPLNGAVVVDPAAAGVQDPAAAWRLARRHAARRRTGPDDDLPASPEAALARRATEQILGVPVGAHDDLFALGATSLQLMRILLRVRDEAGVDVPLARFFAAPTVAVLAGLIDRPDDASRAALELIDEIAGES